MSEQDAIKMLERPDLSFDEVLEILHSFLHENGFVALAKAMERKP